MTKILYKKTNFKKVGFSTMPFTAKILSWRFRHLNIVGCLLKRRPSKGVSRGTKNLDIANVHFVSPLALRYIDVSLYVIPTIFYILNFPFSLQRENKKRWQMNFSCSKRFQPVRQKKPVFIVIIRIIHFKLTKTCNFI